MIKMAEHTNSTSKTTPLYHLFAYVGLIVVFIFNFSILFHSSHVFDKKQEIKYALTHIAPYNDGYDLISFFILAIGLFSAKYAMPRRYYAAKKGVFTKKVELLRKAAKHLIFWVILTFIWRFAIIYLNLAVNDSVYLLLLFIAGFGMILAGIAMYMAMNYIRVFSGDKSKFFSFFGAYGMLNLVGMLLFSVFPFYSLITKFIDASIASVNENLLTFIFWVGLFMKGLALVTAFVWPLLLFISLFKTFIPIHNYSNEKLPLILVVLVMIIGVFWTGVGLGLEHIVYFLVLFWPLLVYGGFNLILSDIEADVYNEFANEDIQKVTAVKSSRDNVVHHRNKLDMSIVYSKLKAIAYRFKDITRTDDDEIRIIFSLNVIKYALLSYNASTGLFSVSLSNDQIAVDKSISVRIQKPTDTRFSWNHPFQGIILEISPEDLQHDVMLRTDFAQLLHRFHGTLKIGLSVKNSFLHGKLIVEAYEQNLSLIVSLIESLDRIIYGI